MKFSLEFISILVLTVDAVFALQDRSQEYWDWASIDTSVVFPQDFVWGSAVAEYQVSGADVCKDSNWAFWEQKSAIEASGNACEFWHRCFDDVALIKDLGLDSFRFSVDWSLVEPRQGEFDEDVLAHYELLCQKLLENGIKPVVTLHHFAHPQWFEELGAFEKEENIRYFVDFSQKAFERLHKYVFLWGTINEPSIYIFGGYIRKVFPPGVLNLHKAGVVLGNLLKSHVGIYKRIKSLPGGQEAKVGIVHQMLPFKACHEGGIRKPIESFVAKILNHMLNDSIMNFFKTGNYVFRVPNAPYLAVLPWVTASVTFTDADAPGSLDYLGINNYSHVRISISSENGFSEGYRPEDIKTDMPYPFYAEGLYHAIAQASEFGVPMYITENGIADAKDDKRALWIEQYLYAVNKAIEDGYDVRGFYYWSLLDNYEWDMGYPLKFGLYEVDRATQKRTLRDGARAFERLVKASKASV